jgi:HK97 family phage prohead protease
MGEPHPTIPGLEISSGTGYISHVGGKALGSPFEQKAAFSQRGNILAGYATRYQKPFFHNGEFVVIMPNACSDAILSGKSVRALIDHDEGRLITTTRAGGLHFRLDAKGLAFVALLPDTLHGREAAEMAATGQAGMSVSGQFIRHETKKLAGENVRLIHEIALDEISICRRGAVPGSYCFLLDMKTAGGSTLTPAALEVEGSAVKMKRALSDIGVRLTEALA